MTHEEAKKIVDSLKKGTIRTVTYTKPLKTRKGIEDVVTKTTTMQVRLGVKYNNMKAVKAAKAEGKLNHDNYKLEDTYEWLDDNFIKNKKTGNVQLRMAYANGNKTITEYKKNGVVVEKVDIEPLCLKSETIVKTDAPTVFNIGVEKIISIK